MQTEIQILSNLISTQPLNGPDVRGIIFYLAVRCSFAPLISTTHKLLAYREYPNNMQ